MSRIAIAVAWTRDYAIADIAGCRECRRLRLMRPPTSPGVINVAPTSTSDILGVIDVTAGYIARSGTLQLVNASAMGRGHPGIGWAQLDT